MSSNEAEAVPQPALAGAQPRMYSVRTPVNLGHHLDLRVAFSYVALIDTQRVHP